MIKHKHDIYKDLFTLRDYAKEFLKHPVEKIKSVPVVSWESCVVGIFGLNIVLGILRAFYQFSVINFIIALFITPIIASITLVVISLFIYYFFQILFKETYNFEKICSVLFMAYVPGAIFYMASVAYAPFFLLGLSIHAALTVVGLEENLQVPKKTIVKLVGIGCFIAVIFWITGQVFQVKQSIDPKSLDQLEEEMNDR